MVEAVNRSIKLLSRSCETPPDLPALLILITVTERLHQASNDIEALRIFFRPLEWPVLKVDDPTVAGIIRPPVKFLAVEIRPNDVRVASVASD
jgi:hypothetical protein